MSPIWQIERLYFTGVPGSRWSGIAQTLEQLPGFNTSDRTPERTYDHHKYSGHKGAYFGRGMEFPADLDRKMIDSAWQIPGGVRVVKSHDWAYDLPGLYQQLQHDERLMLVYRPDMTSFAWWHEAGGFQIEYPSYTWYENSQKMLAEIQIQNRLILEFGYDIGATWHHFTSDWIKENFEKEVEVKTFKDILVALI